MFFIFTPISIWTSHISIAIGLNNTGLEFFMSKSSKKWAELLDYGEGRKGEGKEEKEWGQQQEKDGQGEILSIWREQMLYKNRRV